MATIFAPVSAAVYSDAFHVALLQFLEKLGPFKPAGPRPGRPGEPKQKGRRCQGHEHQKSARRAKRAARRPASAAVLLSRKLCGVTGAAGRSLPSLFIIIRRVRCAASLRAFFIEAYSSFALNAFSALTIPNIIHVRQNTNTIHPNPLLLFITISSIVQKIYFFNTTSTRSSTG